MLQSRKKAIRAAHPDYFSRPLRERPYSQTEQVLTNTNERIAAAPSTIEGLREDGVLFPICGAAARSPPARTAADKLLTQRAAAGPEFFLIARLGSSAGDWRIEFDLEDVLAEPQLIAVPQEVLRMFLK